MKFRSIFILLTILFISLQTQAQDLPFTVNADTFTYSENGEEFIAEGEVYVFSENESLKTDKLIYNKKEDRIYALGNVVMLDRELNTTYTDRLELSGDFKRGVTQRMIVIFEDTTGILQASKAVKVSPEKMNLFNVNYSSCPLVKDESRPWHVTAKKVSYNSEKEYIIYRNAVLNIKDIPVMYMPMFYHSTNTTKPVSGFLNPGLASSTTDGFGFKVGYFWAIDENQDATFRARYLGKRGTVLGAEHRYVGKHVNSDIRVEGISDKEDNDKLRGVVKAEVEYVFEEGKRMGLNTTTPSDNDYLDDFKDITDAYTSTTIYAEDADRDHYIGFSSRYFMDMRNDVDDDTLAKPVARLQTEKLYDIGDRQGQIKLSSDLLTLIRQNGQDTSRAIGQVEYIRPFYTPDGSLFEFNASVRGDYYRYKEDNDGAKTQVESHILPQASVSWEKPFVSSDFKHTISPKLMFIASPEQSFEDNPNEDSTSFELDATNLFETNRFSGYDRVETGNRVVYGIDTKYGTAGFLNFQGFFGQSYNFSDKEEDISDDTKSNNKNSDWVGFIRIKPTALTTASTSFRLDNDTFSPQRVDSSVRIGTVSKYEEDSEYNLVDDYAQIVHSFLKDDSEEVNLYGYYNLSEDFALKGHVQHNIFENITQTQEVDFLYHSCCYNLSFKVRKTQSDDDEEDSLDFLVNFAILPTGRSVK